MATTTALFVASLAMFGIGLWAVVAALMMAYVCFGFTGTIGDGWLPILMLIALSAFAFWCGAQIAISITVTP